ncbi:MAG TPA: hypothetical protein VNF28_01700 [Candidatus Binataceae bacterium]|nr:hypothetical protein [Candidatus Binataceae bacterium]
MDCYITFTKSQHGHHAHVIVTYDPSFKTPEERFDQLGPLSIEPELGDAEIGERIAAAMNHWLAEPANLGYLAKSARPVAVFYDARADDPVITSIVPRHLVDCIATAIYNPANPHELPCRAFTLDPLVAAQYCR